MKLGMLDAVVLCAYFVGTVVFGIVMAARSKTKSSSDFFLASKTLPWYAVGASFIASNISTEHFIGMVGWGFLYGTAVANWEWGNVVTFSLLIWVFLPFYRRGEISTMPEFLERRFNRWCRYIYAVVTIVGLVAAMLGGVMFAGAKAMSVFFPQLSMTGAILILAAGAGAYTVYGGLLSAVWADLVQYILLMAAGLAVLLVGLWHVGGLQTMVAEMPEKFLMFYPPTHEMIPFTGVVFGLFSVGLWYSCANQFMVQRCLGARSEWDARMGVVMAGFSKALLPFLVVVPGMIAFYIFQDRINDGDRAWPFLVRQWLPPGLVGLVLAGLASAILSTLSAISSSSATIFTLDLYKELVRPDAKDRELHFVGRVSTAAAMVIGVVIALVLARFPGFTVFQVIQQVFFYIAGPIAAIFLVGILWRRATPAAALWTLITGFVVILPLTKYVLFQSIPVLRPFDNFMHHTFAVFVLSCAVLVIVSLFTKPKAAAELEGVIWTRKALGFAGGDGAAKRGARSLTLWWALMVGLIVGLCAVTHLQGAHTQWFEAENLAYAAPAGGTTRLQPRSELAQQEHFNLWTGRGQVLFAPEKEGDALVFDVPVKHPGRYAIAALVTVGPDYGSFSVEVDQEPTELTYPVTVSTVGKNDHTVEHATVEVFPAGDLAGGVSGEAETASSGHFVRRIAFGTHELPAGQTALSFIARDSAPSRPALIGVDQVILTPKDQVGRQEIRGGHAGTPWWAGPTRPVLDVWLQTRQGDK